jgi:hypothetical protein
MIKPFTYAEEPWPIRDNIALVQALERCSAAYRSRCLTDLCGERPNVMWVRLYAASEKLKHAVNQQTVVRAILEIGCSFLGCDDTAILELHGDNLSLCPGSGATAGRIQAVAANAGSIAFAIKEAKISIVNTDTPYNELWTELGITAFIPVWHENSPRGAILFYSFLPERGDLDLADRELLRLLSMFAGPSLFNT